MVLGSSASGKSSMINKCFEIEKDHLLDVGVANSNSEKGPR